MSNIYSGRCPQTCKSCDSTVLSRNNCMLKLEKKENMHDQKQEKALHVSKQFFLCFQMNGFVSLEGHLLLLRETGVGFRYRGDCTLKPESPVSLPCVELGEEESRGGGAASTVK